MGGTRSFRSFPFRERVDAAPQSRLAVALLLPFRFASDFVYLLWICIDLRSPNCRTQLPVTAIGTLLPEKQFSHLDRDLRPPAADRRLPDYQPPINKLTAGHRLPTSNLELYLELHTVLQVFEILWQPLTIALGLSPENPHQEPWDSPTATSPGAYSRN